MNPPLNERVNSHPSSLVRKYADNGKPSLIAAQAKDLLNLRRLPAMLTAAQTAVLLNRGEHDIPILVREGLIAPLGGVSANSVKYFATVEILELATNRDKLDRVCTVLRKYWRHRNASKGRESEQVGWKSTTFCQRCKNSDGASGAAFPGHPETSAELPTVTRGLISAHTPKANSPGSMAIFRCRGRRPSAWKRERKCSGNSWTEVHCTWSAARCPHSRLGRDPPAVECR